MSSVAAVTTRKAPAWGGAGATVSPAAAASLAEIMDEEVARKEQRREELLAGLASGVPPASYAPHPVAAADPVVPFDEAAAEPPAALPDQRQQESQQEDDAALARKLAEQEDYLYALELQRAMDASASGTGRGATAAQTQEKQLQQAREYTGAGADVVLKSVRASVARQQQQRQQRHGGAPRTKHDAEECGRRNAARLERFMDDGDLSGMALPGKDGFNVLREHARREDSSRARRKESSDASRSDAVLDNSTRITLLGLMNSDVIEDLGGVVSSGKEANVYHAMRGKAVGEEGQPLCAAPELAVKVFKTMNEFRNRDIYISGDFLAQYEKARLHPRKCIQLWAQKELRNLGKMHRNGIRCPEPLGLYSHVLVMEFLGGGGIASPMLRDAKLRGVEEWTRAYCETALVLRSLYHRCNLVHADMSEYNLLWHDDHVWVIDVAQAVSSDHPNATLFLRRDCRNVSAFFRRQRVAVLSARGLFEFVCDPTVAEDAEKIVLEHLMTQYAQSGLGRGDTEEEEREEADDEAFLKTNMPGAMSGLRDPVAFAEGVAAGDKDCLSHLTMVGLRPVAADLVDDEEDGSDMVEETE